MAIRIDEYGHIIRDNEPTPNRSINTDNIASVNSTEPDQLYVPDDPSLLRDLDVIHLNSNSSESNFSTSLLETSIPWYGSDGAFWTITMILDFIVAIVTAIMIVPMIFESGDNSSNFLESITNFLFDIAPYAVFIGAFVSSIWYNIKGTKQTDVFYHAAYEYILSPLCAIVGAICAGVLLFLLTLAVYIIVVVIGIAIIVGLFSGG